jgi:hypothetical protein
MKYFVYLLLSVILQVSLFAQEPIIDSIWFDKQNSKINASVSGLKNPKSQVVFKLRSSDKLVTPNYNSYSFKEGKNNQQAIAAWDYKKDNFNQISGSFAPTVTVIPMHTFQPNRNITNSILWPGLGGKELRNSNYSWLKGFVGWGLLATGAVLSVSANNQYNKIATSQTKGQASIAQSSYNSQFAASMACFGGAAVLWTFDLAAIFNKNRKARAFSVDYGDGALYVPDFKNGNEITEKNVNIDTRPEIDIALEKANNQFAEKKYVLAKESYTHALLLKPDDEIIKKKIQDINDLLNKGKRGLPPSLYAQLSFMDENGNGVLEALESATLKLTIINEGEGYANNLQVKVKDSQNDTALILASQKIDFLRNGESKTIEILIKANLDIKTDQHRLEIDVLEQFGFDMDPAYLLLNTYAYNPSKINLGGFEIIDKGNDVSAVKQDGSVQPGEKVKVKMILQNIGQNISEKTTWSVTSDDANFYVDNNTGDLGDVNIGEVKEVYFYLTPNKRTAAYDTLPLYLTINERLGHGSFKKMKLPIMMDRKPVKPNILAVKSDLESLRKSIASFEYKSKKFTVNIGKIADIRNVPASKTSNKNAVAVIIGVEHYQYAPPAPYASNDASIIEEYFKKRLGIDNIILLRDDEVTSSKFKKIFNPDWGDLQRSVVKGETDVYVYYSGHGMPNKDGSKVYLFPNDGIKEGVEQLGYSIEELYADLNKINAHSTTVILDACFSGSSRSSEKLLAENISGSKGIKIKAINPWVGNNKFTVITSSTGEETSLGLDASETGLFTYYLCNGLLGSADADSNHKITVGELKSYVVDNVKTASVKIAGIQTPQFVGDENRVLLEY